MLAWNAFSLMQMASNMRTGHRDPEVVISDAIESTIYDTLRFDGPKNLNVLAVANEAMIYHAWRKQPVKGARSCIPRLCWNHAGA